MSVCLFFATNRNHSSCSVHSSGGWKRNMRFGIQGNPMVPIKECSSASQKLFIVGSLYKVRGNLGRGEFMDELYKAYTGEF